eukprot:3447482-Amphidinium_carterae.1
MGFNRLKSDERIFGNVKTNAHLMAYVDDLLVVGNPSTVKAFLEKFKVRLELKHVNQLTVESSRSSWASQVSFNKMGQFSCHAISPQYYGNILKPYNMERCSASTTPGSKKPTIKATPLNREQHSQRRTASAVDDEELGRSLQCPDEEDQRNLKQLLRYVRGVIHYRVKLEPELEHNDRDQIKVSIESRADSDWSGFNTTRNSTSGSITMCWGVPLLHISTTQPTIALSSGEAELYAMGQATIESQQSQKWTQRMSQ